MHVCREKRAHLFIRVWPTRMTTARHSARDSKSAHAFADDGRDMPARARRCVRNETTTQPFELLCRHVSMGGTRLLPALFIIGSLKTGTTALWSQLVDNSEGHVIPGQLTDKGDVSRKEKDFFGDPTMWRRGSRWYDRIWPPCPSRDTLRVAMDATPAYHVWHDSPKNMVTYFGDGAGRLRLVWMLRDPVAKFWSYFWCARLQPARKLTRSTCLADTALARPPCRELKAYGGHWDSVTFPAFTAPKLARTVRATRTRSASGSEVTHLVRPCRVSAA